MLSGRNQRSWQVAGGLGFTAIDFIEEYREIPSKIPSKKIRMEGGRVACSGRMYSPLAQTWVRSITRRLGPCMVTILSPKPSRMMRREHVNES
jgi:hypothetical protein